MRQRRYRKRNFDQAPEESHCISATEAEPADDKVLSHARTQSQRGRVVGSKVTFAVLARLDLAERRATEAERERDEWRSIALDSSASRLVDERDRLARRVGELEAALRTLVEAKDIKAKHGDCLLYRGRRIEGWRLARAALAPQDQEARDAG